MAQLEHIEAVRSHHVRGQRWDSMIQAEGELPMNLRGRVVSRWDSEGSGNWDYERTRRECLKADAQFHSRGESPAPRFREEVELQNEPYVRRWIMGCHFEWLNPR